MPRTVVRVNLSLKVHRHTVIEVTSICEKFVIYPVITRSDKCIKGDPTQIHSGADDGNRTRMASLEGWSSTIELHPQLSRGLASDLEIRG